MDYIQLGVFYGVISAMLQDMPKPKREEWYDKLGFLQEKKLIPEFDWSEITETPGK